MINRSASQPPRSSPANTVLLAGAGISLDGPSCFPVGSSVVNALAEWLGDGDGAQTEKAKAALTHGGANPYSFMRFEQMWETLELLVPGISGTMESLERYGAPNANHDAIADFLDHGGTLITTNFDRRIEQALRQRDSNLRPWVFGARPRAPATDTRFFKIHGSFGFRRKVLSSLFAIGSAGLLFSRYPSLRRALLKRVAGRSLVIAGYSFSDHFDLVPLIEQYFEPSQVIWIRYDKSTIETRFIPFQHVDDLPIPDPSASFEHAALARFRNRLPDIPVWEVKHARVADVLTALGLASPGRPKNSIRRNSGLTLMPRKPIRNGSSSLFKCSKSGTASVSMQAWIPPLTTIGLISSRRTVWRDAHRNVERTPIQIYLKPSLI
jgi:hypothetical protein